MSIAINNGIDNKRDAEMLLKKKNLHLRLAFTMSNDDCKISQFVYWLFSISSAIYFYS